MATEHSTTSPQSTKSVPPYWYTKKPCSVIKCQRCGVEFLQGRSDQRHCSTSCRQGLKGRTQKTCEICGSPFLAIGTAAYCSEPCRAEGVKQKKQDRAALLFPDLKCKRCGESFTPKREGRVGKTPEFCSKSCAKRSWGDDHATITAECRTCEKAYLVALSPLNSGVYCSEECRDQPVPCKHCGQHYIKADIQQRYCSDACQAEAQRRATKIARSAKGLRLTAPFIELKCVECGKAHQANILLDRMYCSDKCARRVVKRNRRARLRSAFVEHVFLDHLLERDGGICQLCMLPVDRDAVVPEVMAPTVDHIIPLAKGGEHSNANCQLAHFLCNSLKSDTLAP
jgi:HNH endonuclease